MKRKRLSIFMCAVVAAILILSLNSMSSTFVLDHWLDDASTATKIFFSVFVGCLLTPGVFLLLNWTKNLYGKGLTAKAKIHASVCLVLLIASVMAWPKVMFLLGSVCPYAFPIFYFFSIIGTAFGFFLYIPIFEILEFLHHVLV
ncbi:MAG: hypothetical protein K2G90_08205 [Muribaculaceae bacterium]|nr:hypothetical protein [Muribaculaceae bacterium]